MGIKESGCKFKKAGISEKYMKALRHKGMNVIILM